MFSLGFGVCGGALQAKARAIRAPTIFCYRPPADVSFGNLPKLWSLLRMPNRGLHETLNSKL